ncbi:tryptophan 7-halogenase [Sphingomonas sp. HT-1]|uniref:tryptophan 7-halogenase n=1 Tax=unclassified Sphingomonas TaxID=196159 RepID=UPI0002E5C1BE|nr:MULTISPECIES: tryptophan 7-halogenase [unclassified Sphingomonas]KTF68541.1 tryptophan halogenase [Sphingomonas sp. WG]
MSAPRRVLVVGGGVTGWSAAAALKRHVPLLDVAILPLDPPAHALADRIACTLPSILGFHEDLGIGVDDAVLRTRSFYRLGTRFLGWSGPDGDFIHSYARHGEAMGSAPFHLLWARAAMRGDVPPFEAFSPAAVMARAGRMMLPTGDDVLADHGFGLALDLQRYSKMIVAFARHVGVRIHAGGLKAVIPGADGGITALTLDDGSLLAADLFVDCTGPDALLHGTLGATREDWRRWLPCDRLVLSDAPTAEPAPNDTIIAEEAGWRWTSPTQTGRVFASSHTEDDALAIRLEAGATLEPWRGNVIAVGDAAVVIEPLVWANLHLAHSAIDRLIAMLPAGAPHPLETAEYNRQALAEARRVRDFVLLHYCTSRRDELFWRDIASAALPESLAHSLRLFRARGRLPFYEEETFDRDSWLAVLFGQGVLPRSVDPLADAVSSIEAERAMQAFRARIDRAIQPLPTPAALLAAQSRHLHERA